MELAFLRTELDDDDYGDGYDEADVNKKQQFNKILCE